MRYAVISNIGKDRTINQDAVFAADRDGYGLFVAADGMGGYSHGELASRHIVQTMESWWNSFEPSHFEKDFQLIICGIRAALEQANRDIYQRYNQNHICGSTVVSLFVSPDVYGIFSAGDSRIYMHHECTFAQLTSDDIWENQADLSESEKNADWEQCRGKLTNAVGINEELRCTVRTDVLKEGMVFLLCSDGLYKFCSEACLKRYLRKANRQKSLEQHSQSLLRQVYRTKVGDDISMITVCI